MAHIETEDGPSRRRPALTGTMRITPYQAYAEVCATASDSHRAVLRFRVGLTNSGSSGQPRFTSGRLKFLHFQDCQPNTGNLGTVPSDRFY